MPEETNDTIEQAISSYRQNLVFNAKDEDLLVAINKAITESKEKKEEIDKIGRRNKKYWRNGSLVDTSYNHPKKLAVVSNRIFTDTETSIPILTSQTPEPTIIGVKDTTVKDKIKKLLMIAYEVKYRMQSVIQIMIRHWFIYRIGVLKYRWSDDGFITENVIPKKIGFDMHATNLDNCEYIFEQLEDTLENILEKFPKKSKELKKMMENGNEKTKVKYIEFWGGGGEWVCWMYNNIILDKKKNPNFNYDTENIFSKPRFPYIFLRVFALGDETGMYDETSLVEQCASVQEAVNRLEQQILELNEGQKRVWVFPGDAISPEKAQTVIDETGDLGIYLDRKGSADAIGQVQSGKPDASLFNNLSHLLSEIDNIMGIHSTTRGERAQQETLGGRQLLMGSDYGRLDLIVRNVEQSLEDWYNAYLQMIKVYALEDEVIETGEEVIEVSPDELIPGLKIMVKKGTTLPIDERSRMQAAVQLAQFRMIDPKTLFEEMGYPDVEKRTQELFGWLQMTGQIQTPQQQMMMQQMQLAAKQGRTGGGEVGQEQGGVGQEGGPVVQQTQQQMQRLQSVLTSPQFQQMSAEDQKATITEARQIVERIKGQQGA